MAHRDQFPSDGSPKGIPSTPKKLQQLLDHHQRIVDALTLTLSLMNGHGVASSVSRTPQIISEAVMMDAARRAQNLRRTAPARAALAAKHTKKARTWPTTKGIKAQRAKTAQVLARFDKNEPRRYTWSGMGSLVRRGYLVKAKDGSGYLRTEKEYSIDQYKKRA